MKIAVEGCCHGELDKIYETVASLELQNNIKIDLLLICGDFQAVRNLSDMQAMAVPPKYRTLQTFHKYYSGEAKAPVLTIFIGGNHEASNYLQELPYGGWVAPNIYYLGYAGVVQFGGIRIAGISGIYNPRDYMKGHYEHPPYSNDTVRSCYHVRNIEVFRLKQIKQPIDIFLSHDWPRGIHRCGNVNRLLQQKKFFKEDIANNTLGSVPLAELLQLLQPSHWFSAHLHVKFAAVVQHKDSDRTTKFLALDKCLPRRQFLQVITLDAPETDGPARLELDPEWLCVLRNTNHFLRLTKGMVYLPGPNSTERFDYSMTSDNLNMLKADFDNMFRVPDNFVPTAPVHDPSQQRKSVAAPQMFINPQTILLCEMVGLTDPFSVFSGKQSVSRDGFLLEGSGTDDSLQVDDTDEGLADDSDFINSTTTSSSFLEATFNPDEISLDDDDESPPAAGALLDRADFPQRRSPSMVSPLSSENPDGAILTSTATEEPAVKRASMEMAETDLRRPLVLPPCNVAPDDSAGILGRCSPELSLRQEGAGGAAATVLTSTPINEGAPRKMKRRNLVIYALTDDSATS